MQDERIWEKKIFDLRQLLEISRALNSTLDYHYLIQAVLDMCLTQARTLKVNLFLTPDIDSNVLLSVNSREMNKENVTLNEIDLDSPMIKYIEERSQILTMSEILKIFPNNPSTKILKRLEVDLIIGMVIRGRVLGLIVLGEKITGEQYTQEECSFLADLANLSGIAVTNARLYERATVDIMTGLKNFAFFQTALKEECIKAFKKKLNLALLFTDIDFFKKVNDTYGHQAGDLILKTVSNKFHKTIRNSDIAARYGGEEICIIMPNTKLEEAKVFAERLRTEIENLSIQFENKLIKITISIGVAEFNPSTDKSNIKNFIQRADKALYKCKKNGRNQVQIYSQDLE